MTWALCFHCGATKFGAICPCEECGVASTGNIELDISFSDHRLSQTTLTAFGEVIRSIRQVCPDDQQRFWTFIQYVSARHPEILAVRLSPDMENRCEETLALANPPPVIVEESPQAKMLRTSQQPADDATETTAETPPDGGKG